MYTVVPGKPESKGLNARPWSTTGEPRSPVFYGALHEACDGWQEISEDPIYTVVPGELD